MAFEKYWKEKAAYDSANKPEMVKIIPAQSPAFNRSILLASIYDMASMSDSDLRKFVQNSYRLILNNIFFGSQESADYIACFTNARFLDAFFDVISTIQYFERDEIVKINTICYHYITLNMEKDQAIVNRLINISNFINRTMTPRLLGLGLTRTLANLLVIARNSDLDFNICVRRVNFIIITQPQELMTENMIQEILRILYDIREWDKIFSSIMLDVLPEYDESNQNTYWITEEVQNVDSELSLAALNILESMTTHNIRQVLVNYAEGYAVVHNKKPVRFSMRRLSDDYQRINDVVDRLRQNENIIVP